MLKPIAFQLFRGERKWRKILRTYALSPGSLPGLAYERTHLLKPAIAQIARDELVVRTLNDEA